MPNFTKMRQNLSRDPVRRLGAAVLLLGAAVVWPLCIPIYEAFTAVDLPDIRERGKLRVITAYSATSYFLYKGQPMGFEYDLLQKLAADLGVGLEIVVTSDLDNIAYMVNSGVGDLVAANIVVTRERARQVVFTQPLMNTRQVLVQRRPEATPEPDKMIRTRLGAGEKPVGPRQAVAPGRLVERAILEPVENTVQNVTDVTNAAAGLSGDSTSALPVARLIRDPIELIGKRVSVRGGSVFFTRLRNLEDEIGGDIDIVAEPGDVSTDELIGRVSSGQIDYTIADEPTALVNRAYYTGLDVDTAISFPQRIAWVVPKNSPDLLKAINLWILRVQQTGELAMVYARYYRNPRAFVERVESEYYSITGTRISAFDEAIRAAAGQIGWDWRLLSSLVYQESRFNPRARSWAGASGLMQLMPDTGRAYGAVDLYHPEQNIAAGAKFLRYLEETWTPEIADPQERLKFVLASYNAGPGHVEDARVLAADLGRDPNLWDGHVAEALRKLDNPEYYNRSNIKYGYCRGQEPYNYVTEILARFEEYKKLIRRGPGDPAK